MNLCCMHLYMYNISLGRFYSKSHRVIIILRGSSKSLFNVTLLIIVDFCRVVVSIWKIDVGVETYNSRCFKTKTN